MHFQVIFMNHEIIVKQNSIITFQVDIAQVVEVVYYNNNYSTSNSHDVIDMHSCENMHLKRN